MKKQCKGRPVTYATMIMTDGTTTVAGVFRAHVEGRKRPFIDLHKAHIIATEKTTERQSTELSLTIAKKYETPEYPAFAWNKEAA